MAELNINAADIAEVLRRNLENFTPGVTGEEVGRIREIGDGIARITGLPNVAVNAVSYTHLDVYKRQVHRRPLSSKPENQTE